MHLPTPTIDRRDFLAVEPRADHVLVVVFLRGGADGLTLVPPVGDDAYHRARPMLRLRADECVDLDGYFGLNAALTPLARHLDDGRLAIVHGAGSDDRTRSHFEAQDTMEHGGTGRGSGWLARYLRAAGAGGALSSIAIGATRPESLRGAPSGAVLQTIRDFSFGGGDERVLEDLQRLYARAAGPLGAAARDTIAAVRRLRAVREANAPPRHGAVYPESSFGRGLREIARLIRADVGLVATTIDLGGWDTHFVQSRLIGGLMRDLAAGLDAFATDLGPESTRVTTVVMTEFGRRLRENTSFGTDHGAGGLMMVLGDDAALVHEAARPVRCPWTTLESADLDAVGDVPVSIDYRDVLGTLIASRRPEVDLDRVFGRSS